MKRNFLLLAALAASTFALVAYERPTLKEVMRMRGEGKAAMSIFPSRSDHNKGIASSGVMSSPKKRAVAATSGNSHLRLTEEGAELLGWLNYSDRYSVAPGLYEFGQDGVTMKWADGFYEENQVPLQTGWMIGDKLCGYVYQIICGQLINNVYVEYDAATGEIIDTIQVPLDQEEGVVVMQTGAYDEMDGRVYGYGQLGSSPVFMCSFPDAPEIYDIIRTVGAEELCPTICYNKYEDSLYGINSKGEFVSIDSKGYQTVLFRLPIEGYGNYVTGMSYYPAEDVYYWNVIQEDNTSSMAIIDVKDQSVEIYENFSSGETFSALFCTDDRINPKRPKRPAVSGIDFAPGATNGVVVFSTPLSYMSGQTIEGNLTYTSYLDGEVHSTGEVAPGKTVDVKYENLTDAMHTFGLTVAIDGVASSRAETRSYIGNDTPVAPQGVVLTDNEVSWQPVTQGMHNAYLDLEAMSYCVYINGELVGDTKETVLAIELPSDKPLSLYTASVKAVCHGMESEMSGESNVVSAGEPMQLPVYLEPTYEDFLMMRQYDENGVGWSYTEIAEGNVISSGMSEVQQDSWLFLPPVDIKDAGRLYTFSFDAFTWGEWYTEESVEVMLCNAPNPDGYVSTVISEFKPNEIPANYYGFIQAPAPGTYYVALHCTSSEWQLGVLAMHFSITDDNVLPTSPGVATEISVEPGAEGKLEARVGFNMPVIMINGEAMPSDEEVVAKISSDVADTEVKGKPGERVEAIVATVQGNNTLKIIVSDGESNGMAVSVDVFTGVEIPAEVPYLSSTPSEDMMSTRLEWGRPTTGQDGGYVNPEEVTFDIYRYEENYVGWFWQVYAQDVKDTSFVYTMDEGSPQDLIQLGVKTRNSEGVSDKMVAINTMLGTPYALPVNENFDDPYIGASFKPWITYAPDASYNYQQWQFEYLQNVDGSYTGETIGMLGTTWYDDTKGMLGFPRFTTKGCEEVELSITLLNGSNMPKVTLSGETYGSKSVEIGSFEKSETEGLQTYTFRLPAELIGKDWVQVYLNVEYETYSQFVYLEDVAIQGTTVGVSAVEGGTSIAGGVGCILFKGLEGVETSVVSADGKVVYGGRIDSNDETIQMQKGVYMVKSGSQSAKVFVK